MRAGHYPRRQRGRQDQLDEPICMIPFNQAVYEYFSDMEIWIEAYTNVAGQQEVQRKLQGDDRRRLPHQGSAGRRQAGYYAGAYTSTLRLCSC